MARLSVKAENKVFGILPGRPAFPKVAYIDLSRPRNNAINIQIHGFGKPRMGVVFSYVW